MAGSRFPTFTFNFGSIVPALLLLLLGAPPPGGAGSLSTTENQKIEALIKRASSLKDAQFIRNGSSYSADKAAIFLRRKWQANDSVVHSARDFIEKVASVSGTSGKPYLIRFKDGKEIESREFFLGALEEIEQRPAPG
jgi:hypothetical protein